VPLLRCPGGVEYAHGVVVLVGRAAHKIGDRNSWVRAATSPDRRPGAVLTSGLNTATMSRSEDAITSVRRRISQANVA
jgi:hypothetical protein